MRRALALIVLAACGGGGTSPDAQPDARSIDAATAPDGAPACGATWRFERRGGTSVAMIDPAPLNSGRTVRVKVGIELAPCEQLGMITSGRTFESLDISIDLGVWIPIGLPCPTGAVHIDRPVSLTLETPGTWHIGTGTAAPLTVQVAAAPTHACGANPGACDLDCDCNAAAGERCLGSTGFAGPLTMCVRPCELDRDCGGDGQCKTLGPGLEFACSSDPECDADHACAAGFTCTAGACVIDTALSSATRHPCGCDADCAAPLRCVEPTAPGAARRCEVACPTGGPWCSLGHVCGLASADVASLAASDSVCGWVGD
jgi:hypothetical protein